MQESRSLSNGFQICCSFLILHATSLSSVHIRALIWEQSSHIRHNLHKTFSLVARIDTSKGWLSDVDDRLVCKFASNQIRFPKIITFLYKALHFIFALGVSHPRSEVDGANHHQCI